MVVEEDAGVEHADAGRLDFAGDAPEDGLRVALLQRGEQSHQLEVGDHPGEQLARRDLSGHERARDLELREGLEQSAELAHGDGPAVRGFEGGEQRRVGLFLEGHQPDLGAAGPGAFDEQGRVASLARDHGDGPGGVEIGGEETRGGSHGGIVPGEGSGLKPALGCQSPPGWA